VRLLPPPPAAGSPKAVAELAEVKVIAARTTPEMLAAATHDAKDETPDIFNTVIGFDIAKAPAAANPRGSDNPDDSLNLALVREGLMARKPPRIVVRAVCEAKTIGGPKGLDGSLFCQFKARAPKRSSLGRMGGGLAQF